MIIGIGTDIISIERIDQILKKWKDKFAKRILHPAELLEFSMSIKQVAFLAKRFAAKEACAKALGTGFSQGVTMRDLRVANDAWGKPYIEFFRKAAAVAKSKQITHAHLSIADEKAYAIAYVVLTHDKEADEK